MHDDVYSHWWIEVRIDGGDNDEEILWLADGTAGQKAGSRYDQGIYGEKGAVLGLLPEPVADMYRDGREVTK